MRCIAPVGKPVRLEGFFDLRQASIPTVSRVKVEENLTPHRSAFGSLLELLGASVAPSLSDNLTSFIEKRGEWVSIPNTARASGKLLRHKKRMSRTGEFHIGDLFITHRLVSLSAEVAENSSPRRWSILLWGDRSQAAQAAAWIGKVIGTG